MKDLIDSNNRLWHYLGNGLTDKEALAVVTGQVMIQADVDCFRRFITSSNPATRDSIFNEATLPAIWHITPECGDYGDPNARLSAVRLNFTYTYNITINDGEQYEITNQNAAHFWNRVGLEFLELNNATPTVATVRVSPYHLSLASHDLGVDLHVYYRWTDTIPLSNIRVLRLRMHQDPIPALPLDAPPPSYDQWRMVGEPVEVTLETKLLNELWLFDGIDEFVGSFPNGEIRDKFLGWIGIRATNVYARNYMFPGTQLKYKLSHHGEVQRNYVSIALGWLLDFENQLIGKLIEVCYRWRSTALELLIISLSPH